jgi:hypothetical protein
MMVVENVPSEIVRRLLERGHDVATRTAQMVSSFAGMKATARAALSEIIETIPDSILDSIDMPELSAIDGGMICEARSIGDFCSAVAVSAGTTEESGGCDIWMESVPRAPANKEVLGGLMSSMEVTLAHSIPGRLVMMDGAFLSTMINVSKAIHSSRQTGRNLLFERVASIPTDAFRSAVMTILTESRFVAFPKYTTTNEFADMLPVSLAAHDARTIATIALRPGEMTHFRIRPKAGVDNKRQLIGPALGFSKADAGQFSAALDDIQSCYYRPHPWTPAFRIDMTASSADSDTAVRTLRTVRDTTMTSGIREPFPLYLADLFAKQVSIGSAPVVDMAVLAAVSDDLDAKLLLAMGYRS